jgi:hypothetical protein
LSAAKDAGDDTKNHIYLAIKAVEDWLDAKGIQRRDGHTELCAAIEGWFAEAGLACRTPQGWSDQLIRPLNDPFYRSPAWSRLRAGRAAS